MNIYYENSKGDTINLICDNIAIQDIESLFANEWEYKSMDSINFGGKIKKFYKGVSEIKFTVSIVADSETEFESITKNLHDVFSYDVRMNQNGRLYVNGDYIPCWIYSSKYSEYEDLFYITDIEYVLVSNKPMWIKEANKTINRGTTSSSMSNAMDMPMPCKIKMYGPVSEPYITIGDNIYSVEVDVPSGGCLTIDGLNKLVTLTDQDGEESNAFGYADVNYNIFAKVEPGSNSITNTKAGKVDITLFCERGEPSWK